MSVTYCPCPIGMVLTPSGDDATLLASIGSDCVSPGLNAPCPPANCFTHRNPPSLLYAAMYALVVRVGSFAPIAVSETVRFEAGSKSIVPEKIPATIVPRTDCSILYAASNDVEPTEIGNEVASSVRCSRFSIRLIGSNYIRSGIYVRIGRMGCDRLHCLSVGPSEPRNARFPPRDLQVCHSA